jgi:hypothetical protein
MYITQRVNIVIGAVFLWQWYYLLIHRGNLPIINYLDLVAIISIGLFHNVNFMKTNYTAIMTHLIMVFTSVYLAYTLARAFDTHIAIDSVCALVLRLFIGVMVGVVFEQRQVMEFYHSEYINSEKLRKERRRKVKFAIQEMDKCSPANFRYYANPSDQM